MSKTVTRNDVARLAGVSPPVVSYVLNNSNYVSEEKRQSVLRVVRELNYTPNMFAQSLRTNRINQIALVGDTLQPEFYETLSAKLYDKGYFSSLFYSNQDPAFINRLIDYRFAAIFMASNAFPVEQLNRIVDSGIPLVLYKSREYEGLDPRIVVRAPDFYNGVKMVLNYLIIKGHSRIAYIPPLRYRSAGVYGTDFRAKAYANTLQESHIPLREEFFCTHTKTMSEILSEVLVMLTSHSAEERPTAICAGDDNIAANVMQYVKTLGFSIPDDIAVVGWGNTGLCRLVTPELTSVDDGIPDYASDVSDAIVQMISGEVPDNQLYSSRLIVRSSS